MRLPVFAHTRPRDWIRFLVVAAVVLALPLVFHDPFFVLVLQSLAYLFIVENFPVYTDEDVAAAAARRAEEETRKKARRAEVISRNRIPARTGR